MAPNELNLMITNDFKHFKKRYKSPSPVAEEPAVSSVSNAQNQTVDVEEDKNSILSKDIIQQGLQILRIDMQSKASGSESMTGDSNITNYNSRQVLQHPILNGIIELEKSKFSMQLKERLDRQNGPGRRRIGGLQNQRLSSIAINDDVELLENQF